MYILVYLKPEEVEITVPPIIVSSIKNKDRSKFEEYVVTPDVEIEEIIAKNTLTKPTSEIIKK